MRTHLGQVYAGPTIYLLPAVDRWIATLVADPLLASIGQIKTTLGCAGSSWSHPLPPPSAPLAESAPPRHTCAYVDLGKKEEEGDDSWANCKFHAMLATGSHATLDLRVKMDLR